MKLKLWVNAIKVWWRKLHCTINGHDWGNDSNFILSAKRYHSYNCKHCHKMMQEEEDLTI